METKELLQFTYDHLQRAQDLETKKDYTSSAAEYLEASKFLFEAASKSTGEIKKIRVEQAEKLLKKYREIKELKNSEKDGKIKTSENPGKNQEASTFEDLGININNVPEITFEDVAGLDEVKAQITTKVIYPSKQPETAKKFGVSSGGGILLYGPPGTGKTHIARAIAHEAKATFISINPSTLLSKWFGEFEKNIALLFSLAREHSPSLIFFDEIDSLFPKRSKNNSSVMARAVPQMLSEMDGYFKDLSKPVLVIGATNNPWDMDEAVLRSGRFDEKVYIGPPSLEARKRIFEINSASRPVEDNVDLDYLSKITEGYSGADISYICRKAAETVFREVVESGKERKISQSDFVTVIHNTGPSITSEMISKYRKFEDFLKEAK